MTAEASTVAEGEETDVTDVTDVTETSASTPPSFPAADPCPCDSGETYGDCCGPLHAGDSPIPTAEACLRSRYAAYVVGAIDYIFDTHHSATRDDLDRKSVEAWSQGSKWLGLKVHDVQESGESGEPGEVATITFQARYKQGEAIFDHRERSRFEKEEGAWRFVDAWTPPARTEKKVGRNEPCPCGSGKKFKRCCLKK